MIIFLIPYGLIDIIYTPFLDLQVNNHTSDAHFKVY